ncbi:alpha-2-macroglobulin-like isoform X2 [Carettochelys insculpta]|uniref:alpha-2-macroglobulin-like isoform X2 n=1 Tax=Carettochelys insculpta TaxID=44489 RepID=UPI003EC0C190
MGKDRLPGGRSIFLLLLFFLLGNTSPTTEPQYLVLVPFLIHTNVSERICVQLTHLNESVTLSATLEHAGENRSLIADMVAEKDVFKCVPFTVPKASGLPIAFLTVLVKGPTLKFRSRKSVLVKDTESLVFVQTDKPIYKPGQTVLFRIVSMDEDFRPLNEKFPLVFIKDPQNNRVYQWREVELNHGLIQLSFPLASEPVHGTYHVVVQKETGTNLEHSFTVEEYVLPKFEVLVKLPKKITIEDEELRVAVCSLYTYGTPVPGLVKVRVCRKFSQNRSSCYGREADAVCEEFTKQADSHGCVSSVVKTRLFQLKRKGYEMKIEVEGKVTEEGTGVELTGTGSSEITGTMSKISFAQVDSYYRPGIPFFGEVKLVDGTDAPISNETIQISIRDKYNANYTTNEKGQVWFSIDTVNFTDSRITIMVNHKSELNCYDHNWVTPEYGTASHTAMRFYSESKSFLKIEPVPQTLSCGSSMGVRVHYILKPQAVGEQKEIAFYYLVMAKGGIVRSGTEEHPVGDGELSQVFELRVLVGPEIAPLAKVLVYATLPSGEVIANSENFKIENCFANKVHLHFSPAKGFPAAEAHLHVRASLGSLCAVRAVDKSVLLMKPEAELSPSSVYDLLPVKELRGYSYREHHLEEDDVNACVNLDSVILNGFIYEPVFPDGEGDTFHILQEMGLKVFTSAKVHKPTLCRRDNRFFFTPSVGTPMMAYDMLHSMVEDVTPHLGETVRKYFPETWIWDFVPVNSAEGADLAVTIPDTITEWKANAFCTSSDAGFGLSPTVSLTAFQPFFLELTLPYSVVRGEAFSLKATVFNYLTRCIRVSISLAPSANFSAIPEKKEEESYCLCLNGRKTVSWAVTPKTLGNVIFSVSAEALKTNLLCGNEVVETPDKWRKDTVIKQLLVEPEGFEKETTYNFLLCAAGKTVPQPMSLRLPENVVESSARAYFSVLGDILGTAMQNLQQLIQMPFGCGEQNMALFAPIIYVLDYLNKTGQLNKEIESKAIGYLVTGYQTQLNYKHQDGSYSTFGPRSWQPGNTWLTAFVLKSFGQARSHIFIEERHVQDALTWLAGKQKENGCFRSSGTLLNNAMKGGVDDEVTLSAYITIALLEIALPITHPVVRNALFCLETATEQGGHHVYTRALLAYAFALAGKEGKRRALLDSLDKDAVKEDGSIHWQRPGKQPEVDLPFYRPRAPSAEVEMTSYVLLAYLTTHPAPCQSDLPAAAQIAKWTTKQQNPNGGFSSTQDTVVALQALSLYGACTYAKSGGASTVTLQSTSKFQAQFQVDHTNRLLLQRVALPEVPGDYSMEVTGEGCVYVQTSLRYNVIPKADEEPFALEVHTVPQTCDSPKAHRTFDVAINISYTGKRSVSNMVIVDVKMLSGFIPVRPSVRKLEGHNQIHRTELSANHVLLYMEQVSNVTQSFSFAVEQDFPVQSLKPALVKVYDYYETGEFAIAEYSAPCSKGAVEQSNM